MPRGVELGTLVTRLRAECRESVDVAHSPGSEPTLKQLLRRTQEALARAHDWPHLRTRAEIPLIESQRFYDFPDSLPLENVERVDIIWAGTVIDDLERGIELIDFASFNSLADPIETCTPARKWDVIDTGDNEEQLEVWPVPDASDQTIVLRGQRALRPLIDDDDVCDLDGDMLVLFSAAEHLAADKAADAKLKLDAAQNILRDLTAKAGRGTVHRVGLYDHGPRLPRLRAPRVSA